MFELAGAEPPSWVTKLEGPEEIARLLEVRTNCVYFMDKVLDREDSVLVKSGLDERIVG